MADETNSFYASRYSTIIQTVTVVALFVAGFWGAVIMPLQSQIKDLEVDKLSRSEHQEFKQHVDQALSDLAILKVAVAEHTEFKNRLDKEIAAIVNQAENFPARLELKPFIDIVTNLSNSMISRGELTEHWRSVDQEIVDINKQLDTIRQQQGSAYTLGDEVKRLQSEIDALRNQAPLVAAPSAEAIRK